ncbi:PREDICTED: uncharacterized protein LOC104589164 [Nelumbo nucifera]|uniref:S-protein homolog n=2 Tax=Nelumbo nucifera TaxID=4432 RepID=A0A822XRR3_NELNU|nr:PREDICTED: uncharacterized protein LOC104589164 [Nelumbo nucifera]DAD20158.1 TPA_asm: hypothetical protein HUJ06_021621 [Nelumbo nucifera]
MKMFNFNGNILMSVVVVLVLCLSEAAVVLGKIDVRITNEIGNGYGLSIHCRSKNDDLGQKMLKGNMYAEWAFDANIWGTTLYYCDMVWQLGWGHYDVYVASRDKSRCHYNCWYSARQDGLYAYDEVNGTYSFWARWETNPSE